MIEVAHNNVMDFIKNVEKSTAYKTPIEKRVQNSKLTPIIKKMTNEELKAFYILLSSKNTIKAMEIIYSGRYSESQIYIVAKEILNRATIKKIEVE